MDRSPETLEDRLPEMEVDVALPMLPMLGAPRPGRADAVRNRAAILEAAQRLVADRGALAVTMDEVACAAHVGKGTLFRAFGDRAGLLRALLDESERAFQEEFIRGPAPLGPGAPARERLVAFGERMIDHIEQQGDTIAAAESGVPGLRMRHSVYGTYRAFLIGVLHGVDDGFSEDVGYVADVLLGALAAETVLHQRQVQGMSRSHLKRCWGELVRALTAPPACGGA